MPQNIKVRADDTEPLTLDVGATGLDDLSNVSSAVFYARKHGETENHVDGQALSIPDTDELKVVFDPEGAKADGGDAFDAAGVYTCYILLTHTDGDETRHPGSDEQGKRLTVTVTGNYE